MSGWLLLTACVQEPSASEDTDTSTSDTGSDSTTGEPEGEWIVARQLGNDVGALMSVWGPSPTELYVVGGQPEADGGRVLRGYEDDWELEPLPAGVGMLNWVYGVDGRVWSVGREGTIVCRDGASEAWVHEASPTDRTLWGVWGASADELWAVGGDGVTDAPVLLRRDGASEVWAELELPELGVEAHALFKVWGAAADDVWIVGDAGAALHWDGQVWTPIPDLDGVDLISVWGSVSEGVIAVGGRANARIDRRVEGAWLTDTSAAPGLNGVWIDPSGGATVVGGQGSIHTVAPDGFTLTPESSGTAMALHSVFGFEGGPRYSVGGSLLMAPPYVGVIVRTR